MLSGLAAQLQKVELKKTKPPKTSKKAASLICDSSESYHQLMEETYIEEYMEVIEPLTFPSVFLPCGEELCQTILNLHLEHGAKFIFEEHATPVLQQAASAINAECKKQNWTDSGLFIRLSSRSAKDAVLNSGDSFVQLLKSEFEKLKEQFAANRSENHSHEAFDRNLKLLALYVASTKSLRCADGAECMSMLVRSERIAGDLKALLNERSNKLTTFNICLREFTSFLPTMEFRGFVWNHQLTAITQYNQYVYDPAIVAQKSEFESILIKCWSENLRDAMASKLDHYVIDFIIIDGKATIVELNPFAEFAGLGLFSWEDENDRNILQGRKSFEFRVQRTIPTLASHDIGADWKAALDLLS